MRTKRPRKLPKAGRREIISAIFFAVLMIVGAWSEWSLLNECRAKGHSFWHCSWTVDR
jgi:hypothetical protein